MTWEWIAIALPWVFVLACPLAMFWMMRGMHGGGSSGSQAATQNGRMHPAAVPVRSRQQEIEVLKQRLASLEAEKRPSGVWP